ncbi:MAG: pilus assembly protein N-terminal domain-containing protein, partial [Terriglobales bacterium]
MPDAHAMLFLKSKQVGMPGAVAPAAALTIHPAMSENAVVGGEQPTLIATADNGLQEAPAPVGLMTAPAEAKVPAVSAATEPAPQMVQNLGSSSKALLAQLAPDQVVAQGGDTGTVTATPIPPVVTGTVDLEEFKTTNVIDLKVSQSRTFKLKNKIVRTSISDPAIAEPVVVSENQIVLLGKTPGTATLVLWDDAGNSVAIDLRVTRDFSQLQSTIREIDPRIIVKAFSVGGTDRVMLLGDVDHPDSVVRAFAAANVFMDDRGMTIQVAQSRLINARIGEMGMQGSSSSGGGQTGHLAALSSVDKYTFFGNLNNNIGKAQVISSDGGRVTSLVKVRKVPLIVLHVTFMEMNSSAARALGNMLGFSFSARTFSFGIGGTNSILSGTSSAQALLTSLPGLADKMRVVTPATGGTLGIPGAATQPVAFVGQAVQSFV